MEDYIVNKILDVLNTVESLGSGILIQSPETFNTTLYNGIINIMENAVKPVASVILGIFLALELYNIATRTEGMSNLGIEIPMKTLLKFVLCKVVMDNLRLILLAMYEVSSAVITNMNGVFHSTITTNTTNIETIKTTVESMEFGVQLLTSVEVTIIWLLIKLVSVLVTVIVIARMVELYVLIAISPVPAATLPNAEASSVAKNFLKVFLAVCIQGALIFLVIAMFGIIVSSVGLSVDGAEFSKSLFTILGYAIVLIISLFSTGKWAKSICNAM